MVQPVLAEPEPAWAGQFCWSRNRWKVSGPGLLLCDLGGVLRWQSCGNSYNFSQIITIVTQIERTNRYTFIKVRLFSFILFFFKFVMQIFLSRSRSRELEPVARPGVGVRAGASQSWTGSTTQLIYCNVKSTMVQLIWCQIYNGTTYFVPNLQWYSLFDVKSIVLELIYCQIYNATAYFM